jgi:hypothetical protein
MMHPTPTPHQALIPPQQGPASMNKLGVVLVPRLWLYDHRGHREQLARLGEIGSAKDAKRCPMRANNGPTSRGVRVTA